MLILITCGTLFDGTGHAHPSVTAGSSWVEGDRFIAVGPAEAVAAPPAVETIDLSESAVLPGLSISPFSRCIVVEQFAEVLDEAHRVGFRVAAHTHGGRGLRDCLEPGMDTIEHGTRITEADVDLFLRRGATLVATFNPHLHETVLVPGRPPGFARGITPTAIPAPRRGQRFCSSRCRWRAWKAGRDRAAEAQAARQREVRALLEAALRKLGKGLP